MSYDYYISKEAADASLQFKKRGWIEIKPKLIKQNIYLVKNKAIKVPSKKLMRFTPAEIQALVYCTVDERRALVAAKEIFKGEIGE